MDEALCLEGFERAFEHLHSQVLRRQFDLAARKRLYQRRAGLGRELVGRDVRGPQHQGLPHGLLPAIERLPGHPVHEVQREVLHAERLDGLHGLPRRVAPAEGPQFGVIEGLHAHAYPVDTEGLQRPGLSLVDGVGVRLHRDLGIRRYAVESRYHVEDFLHQAPGEHRGRAAADVDAPEVVAPQEAYLPFQGLGVPLCHGLVVVDGEEVAVVALARAEGDVDVKAFGHGLF